MLNNMHFKVSAKFGRFFHCYVFFVSIWAILFLPDTCLALPAFPGAEGFGADTVGGRGGKVYLVTNLNDSGSGSLRAALEASGPRIVVFRTGGTISLNSTLTIVNPYITIAGQTAPGGGITIKGNGRTGISIKTHDVILRYLTVRVGSGGQTNAILLANYNSGNVYNVVIDHCSLSWATDENLTSWYDAHDITWQWNIVSEALNCSTHPEGCHSMGAMIGGYASGSGDKSKCARDFSFHHNLLSSSDGRNGPYLRGGGVVDIVNNVLYNPGGTFTQNAYESDSVMVKVNIVKNYFKPGPNTTFGKYAYKTYRQPGGLGSETYVEGNYHPQHRPSDNLPEYSVVDPDVDRTTYGSNTTGQPYSHLVSSRWTDAPKITEQSAFSDLFSLVTNRAGNYQRVDCSGSWVNKRDSIDKRIVQDVVDGTGTIIDDESDVGGWISIPSGQACIDTDNDGMPDAFELKMGFNLNTPDDSADSDADGYSNIEEYLNGSESLLVGNPTPIEPPTGLRIATD